MKVFAYGEIEEALKHARAGGQALHLFDPRPYCKPSTPGCFKRASEAGHLFDYDLDRLLLTARRIGIRKIKVDRRRRNGQHVDLVGGPLRRAKAEAKASEGELFA